jgi:hypothetical protein
VSFVPQTAGNVAEADAATSKTGLLDVLTWAEAEGWKSSAGPAGRLPFGLTSEPRRGCGRWCALLGMLPVSTDAVS